MTLENPTVGEVTDREKKALRTETEGSDAELLASVMAFYTRTLKDSPDALEYLQRRGLRHPELIDTFKLGYANRSLGLTLPKKTLKAGKLMRGQLQRVGVLRDSGHEHLNGSLVVPILDAHGQVIQAYGRKLESSKLRSGTALHLNLNDNASALWNSGALEASKEVILCEGVIDGLTFWAHGFRNVVATLGPDKFTPEQAELLTQKGIECVFLAFDRDEEGDRGAECTAELLGARDIEVQRVVFPKGMDANEYAVKSDDPKFALDERLRHAEWMAGTKNEKTEPKAPEKPTPSFEPSEPRPKPEDRDLELTFEGRVWRVRGLEGNRVRGKLTLNLMVRGADRGFHVDRFDLYSHRHRAAFIKLAALELGMDEEGIKKDLGRILLTAEKAQDEMLTEEDAPKAKREEMSNEEREEALEFLRSQDLRALLLKDFETMGIVGEQENLLLGYLAAISRKMERPLALVIQSSSAAGKSSLMDAVLSCVPEEERVSFSAMTGQSLYYMGPNGLRNKILAIEEDEGASKASYAIKILQSSGALSIASTGKDSRTGRLISQEYRVQGPVSVMMTTTSLDADEELLNRCLVVSVDESPEQTARIHERQRWLQTLEGLEAQERGHAIRKKHQNAQRLLRPLRVVNPFALKMAFPELNVRARRDHRKLLGLIEAVTLLLQYQRELKTIERGGRVIEFIEATIEDVQLAQELLRHAVGSGVDDLPPQTARLLSQLSEMLSGEDEQESKKPRFTAREVRERLGLGMTQSKVHLRRLVEAEFVLAHRSPHGRGLVYSLAYDCQPSGPGRGSVGPWSGVGRNTQTPQNDSETQAPSL